MTRAAAAAWFGDRAILVTCEGVDGRAEVYRQLKSALPDRRVRCGMRTVMVESAAPDGGLLNEVSAALASPSGTSAAGREVGQQIEIDVHYDGPDLAEAAQALGLDVEALVQAHTAQAWLVAMMGFAPGFGYLMPDIPLRADWSRLPRRADPRVVVPPGSVAIAAGMSAVYPASMPGGWHLIGRTDAVLFDVGRSIPALLAPDDRIRFRESAR